MAVDAANQARTLEQIEHAIHEQQRRRRKSARATLQLADGLLDQLEMLVLSGRHDVPASLLGSIDAVARAAGAAGINHAQLESDYGVLHLMDDVYDLEAKLLKRCH